MGSSKKRIKKLERKVERHILAWCLVALVGVLTVILIMHFVWG